MITRGRGSCARRLVNLVVRISSLCPSSPYSVIKLAKSTMAAFVLLDIFLPIVDFPDPNGPKRIVHYGKTAFLVSA